MVKKVNIVMGNELTHVHYCSFPQTYINIHLVQKRLPRNNRNNAYLCLAPHNFDKRLNDPKVSWLDLVTYPNQTHVLEW